MTRKVISFSGNAKTRDITNRWIEEAGIRNRGDCSRKINRAIEILDMTGRDSFELLSDDECILFLAHYSRMTEMLFRIRFLDKKQQDSFRERYDTVQGLMNDISNHSTIPDQDI